MSYNLFYFEVCFCTLHFRFVVHFFCIVKILFLSIPQLKFEII